MAEKPEDRLPTRQSLLHRLKDWEDQRSWEEFVRLYQGLILGTALKAGLPENVAQEVVQETWISVAKQMPGFTYDPQIGSFRSWLLAITRRRIIDQLRRKGRDPARASGESASATGTAAIERVPAPESLDLDRIWEEEWRQGLFQKALEGVRAEVDPKHFQIFDCYVLKAWPVEDVVRLLRVSSSQVYVVKHRFAALLKQRIKKLEETFA